MKKKIGLAALAVLCVVVIVGLYYVVSHQEKETAEEQVELNEAQKIITEDLDKNYPATPREVVKLYNRIISCFYEGDYTEEEIEGLGDQARKLFDEELLDNNPREEYMETLHAEIADYHERKKTIMNSSVCSSNDVDYQTVDGDECAYVTSSYFMNENKNYTRTYQMYVLRKDDDGNWKILVFYQIEGESSDE